MIQLTEAERTMVRDEQRREAEAARRAGLPWVAAPTHWLPDQPTLTVWPVSKRETHAAREGYLVEGLRGTRPGPDGDRIPSTYAFRAGGAAAEYVLDVGDPVELPILGESGVLALMARHCEARKVREPRGVWPRPRHILTEALREAGLIVKWPDPARDQDREQRLADARLHGPSAYAVADDRYPPAVYSARGPIVEFIDARADAVVAPRSQRGAVDMSFGHWRRGGVRGAPTRRTSPLAA